MNESPLTHALARAARDGNARAQYLYARCLLRGRGVQRNVREALHWAFQAVAMGSTKAAQLIVRIHRDEHYDPVELQRAADSAERAEQVTFPDRRNLIAEFPTLAHQQRLCRILDAQARSCYQAGETSEAAQLFLAAAKYGYKPAQRQIARMYRDDDGVGADSSEALYWEETAKSDQPLL